MADYGIAPLLDAAQFMIPERIETNDTRLLEAVLRNGKLWTVHHVDGSMNAGQPEVSWYEMEPRQADANGTAGTLGLEVSLDWTIEPELQSFNLYRSTTPDLGDLSCIAQEIFPPPLLDNETLFPGDFRAYLVTGTDHCGNETTLGFAFPAGERQAPFPCN